MERRSARFSGFPCQCPLIYRLDDFGTTFQLDRIDDYGDIRKPSIINQWNSEYFIDATWFTSEHALSPGLPSLGVWAGSNE